jgi:GTPase SAR1 family protein
MNLLPATVPKTFSLLSIGQRGVGKTVFLAGSYSELHSDDESENSRQYWFDCQDFHVRANVEKIKKHVARTGLYPPPTIKITGFNFSLKRRNLFGVKTICNFRWWDIPGEDCNISNPNFQEMVLASNGCCIFINAEAIAHKQEYAKSLDDLFNQVVAIASLVSQYNLKYSFAIILTKCDLIDLDPITQLKIEEKLQPLATRLDAVKANYQKFYSAIPIVSVDGISTLNARGAAAPLIWLLSQLSQSVKFSPSQQNLASGLNQSLFIGQMLPPTFQRYILVLSLLSITLLGAIVWLFLTFGASTLIPEDGVPARERPNTPTRGN